jgi:hypothetical protein
MFRYGMLRSIVRHVMTTMVLLATSVAGLPLVVCVSEAHSAAIEIERLHAGEQTSPEGHFVLFSPESAAQEQGPCKDYRLQAGAIAAQQGATKQVGQPASNTGGDQSFAVSRSNDYQATPRSVVLLVKTHVYRHDGRSTLSDRRSIVLQI